MSLKQPRVALTQAQLRQKLREQLDLLRGAALRFDKGDLSAALQMAVSLRILLYSRRHSKSLLEQLGLHSTAFADTAFAMPTGTGVAFCSLVVFDGNSSIERWWPRLDLGYELVPDLVGVRSRRYLRLPFTDWWQQIIFRNNSNSRLTRKDLVLTMANQDGGAHVDLAVEAVYHELVYGDCLNLKTETERADYSSDGVVVGKIKTWTPIPHAERAAVRQVAHEVLRTLNTIISAPYEPLFPVGFSAMWIQVDDAVTP